MSFSALSSTATSHIILDKVRDSFGQVSLLVGTPFVALSELLPRFRLLYEWPGSLHRGPSFVVVFKSQPSFGLFCDRVSLEDGPPFDKITVSLPAT